MRRKLFYFTPRFVEDLKTNSVFKIVEGLPKDAKVVNCGFNHKTQHMFFCIESETFDDVLEGAFLPMQYITFEKVV